VQLRNNVNFSWMVCFLQEKGRGNLEVRE